MMIMTNSFEFLVSLLLVLQCLPVRCHRTPIRCLRLTVRWHFLPVRRLRTPIRCVRLPVRRHFLPVRWLRLPVRWLRLLARWHFLPVRRLRTPIRCLRLTVRRHCLPITRHYLPTIVVIGSYSLSFGEGWGEALKGDAGSPSLFIRLQLGLFSHPYLTSTGTFTSGDVTTTVLPSMVAVAS